MGIPSQGFWSDNGKEFQNNMMLDLIDKFGLTLRFGPSYSPWANGINERNHGIADKIMQKLIFTGIPNIRCTYFVRMKFKKISLS